MDNEEAKILEKQLMMREMRQEEMVLSTISDEEEEFEKNMKLIDEEILYTNLKQND